MTFDEASDILTGLEHLKFYPSSPAARANLAELLIEITKGDARKAQWLVREIGSTMDEYPGPLTMRDVLHAKFPPSASLYAPTRPFGEKPEIDCETCNDFGFVFNQATNLHQWCPRGCKASDNARRDSPQLISKLNENRRGSRMDAMERAGRYLPPPPEKPITEADIEAELLRHIARKGRAQ